MSVLEDEKQQRLDFRLYVAHDLKESSSSVSVEVADAFCSKLTELGVRDIHYLIPALSVDGVVLQDCNHEIFAICTSADEQLFPNCNCGKPCSIDNDGIGRH